MSCLRINLGIRVAWERSSYLIFWGESWSSRCEEGTESATRLKRKLAYIILQYKSQWSASGRILWEVGGVWPLEG